MNCIKLTKFFIVILQCLIISASKSAYKNVIDELFKDYDPGLRPVLDKNRPTNVTLRFGLIKLLNLDAKAQMIELLGFVELAWTDELLRWNPSEFNDITRFRYPHDKIWKPDIIMTNTPDLNNGPVMNSASTNLMVSSDGSITNAFTVVFKAICRHLSLVDFPFDKHKCYLEFGSWTFNINEVDIFERIYEYELPEGIQEVPNSEWLVSVLPSEKVSGWDCCPNETYSYLRINLLLERKPLYYIINLIGPTIIVCYVAFLGMFCPNSSTGDRMDKAFVCLCTCFTISMLMLNMSAQMPVTSDSVPLICYFLGFYIAILFVAVVVTCVIMHIHLKGLKGRPISDWSRKYILHGMGKFFCLDDTEMHADHHVGNEVISPISSDFSYLSFSHVGMKFNFQSNNKSYNSKKDIQRESMKGTKDELSHLLNEKLQPINDVISNMYEVQRNEEQDRKIRHEWAQLAAVLDRFFLIFFMLLSTIVSILLFRT